MGPIQSPQEEVQMAIVVVNELEGGDQSTYDDVNPRVMPDGNLPDGCQVHIAGPSPSGWRVITVWDSEEQFNEFRNNSLVPALQESGHGDRVSPNITTSEAYSVITA
jgi:hypothetical protein